MEVNVYLDPRIQPAAIEPENGQKIEGPFHPRGVSHFFWMLRVYRQHKQWSEVEEFFRQQGATAVGELEYVLDGERRTIHGAAFDGIVLPFEGTLAVFAEGDLDIEKVTDLLVQLAEALKESTN